MPKIEVNLGHRLNQPEALKRIKSLISGLKAEHADTISQVEETWSDSGGTFSFKARGFKVSGTLKVTDNEVRVSGDLPLAAAFFKGKIIEIITQKGNELLA